MGPATLTALALALDADGVEGLEARLARFATVKKYFRNYIQASVKDAQTLP